MHDILLGMDSKSFDRLLSALYARPSLREKLFCGRAHIASLGTDVSWSINSAPSVWMDGVSQRQWEDAIGADGKLVKPQDNAFLAHIADLNIVPIRSHMALDIICSAYLRKNTLQITALGMILDLSEMSDFDREIFCTFLIPNLLQAVTQMLSGGYIPPIQYEGVRFGPLQLAVGDGMLCFYAALEDGPAPAPPVDIPRSPLILQMSQETVRRLASKFIAQLSGKDIRQSGSESFVIGKASYECGVHIMHAQAKPMGNPTCLLGLIQATPRASANLTLLFVPLDIGYTGSVSPGEIPMELQLGLNGNTLRAQVCRIEEFSIVLTPAGSISSKILSGVAWPLAQIMVLALTNSLKDLLVGQRFDLTSIGAQSFSVCGDTITLMPCGLNLHPNGPMLEITGTIEL